MSAAIRRRPGIRAALAVGLVASAGLLTGCQGAAASPDDAVGGPASAEAPVTASKAAQAAVKAVSTAQVAIEPVAGSAEVRPGQPVRVQAVVGKLTGVTVLDAAGGELPGALAADGSTWVSTAGTQFSGQYTVRAAAVDPNGVGKWTEGSFATIAPTARASARISPRAGANVGVGMPVMVTLTATPGDRKAVEAALSVATSPRVDGSWRWVSKRELHWRPASFWAPGTEVTVNADLDMLDLGEGVWGEGKASSSYSIGSATVSTVDIANHTMTVTQNGAVLRTIPITTGKPGFDTRGGTKVIMGKERTRIMDSDTVDIPENSSEGYRLEVEYAMRLTNSGEFLHAAPWSVAKQGVANVSHGCTGMSNDNAAWLFSVSKIGDVVQYVNGSRKLESGNGWTDWNIPYDAWRTA